MVHIQYTIQYDAYTYKILYLLRSVMSCIATYLAKGTCGWKSRGVCSGGEKCGGERGEVNKRIHTCSVT